jgi:hypothetical protein
MEFLPMAGRPGRSGRKPKSLEAHLKDHTFRPDRHAARLADFQASRSALAMVPAPAPLPDPPAALLDGLGPSGQAFTRELWCGYEFTTGTLPLLRLAAEQVDRLSEARAALQKQPLIVKAPNGAPIGNPWLRIEQRAVRNLFDLLREMHLESDR